jgi:hypothetical protein
LKWGQRLAPIISVYLSDVRPWSTVAVDGDVDGWRAFEPWRPQGALAGVLL